MRSLVDRAQAILLTLQGWTSLELAEAFGVMPEAVRGWRGWFSERGLDALRSTLAPGPSPAKGERALAVASLLLRQPVEDRSNWALPRLRAEVERSRSPVIERQTGASIPPGCLSVLLKQGGQGVAAVFGRKPGSALVHTTPWAAASVKWRGSSLMAKRIAGGLAEP